MQNSWLIFYYILHNRELLKLQRFSHIRFYAEFYPACIYLSKICHKNVKCKRVHNTARSTVITADFHLSLAKKITGDLFI